MFARLFHFFLDSLSVPRAWKSSIIIPIPKKPNVKQMNDFRPVASTSILTKCMERIVCNQLVASVADRMDPLQFAYKARRGVEDACLIPVNLTASYLGKSGSYVRVMFMDFSLAFNKFQPHLLIKRLLDLGANHTLVLWIKQFLCDRPQRVSLNGIRSDELIVNTGAPQGCVLSTILFSVYTNEVVFTNALLTLVKLADDMALVARLQDENSLGEYFLQLDRLNSWFKESFLDLNISKTKELVFNSRKEKDPFTPVTTDQQPLEVVSGFKYLRTVVDSTQNSVLMIT